MTIERKQVGKRLSGLVIHRTSGTVYLSGQVPDDCIRPGTVKTFPVSSRFQRWMKMIAQRHDRTLFEVNRIQETSILELPE